MSRGPTTLPHQAHWGAFRVTVDGNRIVGVAGHPDDPAPSPLHANLLEGGHNRGRVARPAVRRGWLEHGPGPDDRRGTDTYVEVPWDEALGLAAAELRRVRDEHGNEAIFGGSYGWASAGRFHHAQSQLHRFLNAIGGYTSSVGSYSLGASEVVVPHVLGTLSDLRYRSTTWPTILEHTELVVAFGGMNPKNAWVTPGGVTRHTLVPALAEATRRGLRFVLVSPLRSDLPEGTASEWLAPVPGTDTALMLALAHVLQAEDLIDRDFLDRCAVGADRFLAYVRGDTDGVAKDPAWAAAICGIEADRIVDLARRMAAARTLVTVSWALQRAEHGEQPVWAGIALAALLGQIGLPGGGFGHGYGSMADVGVSEVPGPLPTLPQGRNAVATFIPVARITDLLDRPGERLAWNGRDLRLPDIRVVHWAGGNPFHHHQDLGHLRRSFARPDTVIVQDPYWTATARHADIVFPVTTSLERDDVGAGRNDGYLHAMPQAVAPYAEARDDFAVLAGLAERLGVGDTFTEGRSVRQWVEHLYERCRAQRRRLGDELPPFEEFWATGEARLGDTGPHHDLLQGFRADPVARPLPTPSGRIELFSDTVAAFGYDDCPGHPAWLEPSERLGADGVGSLTADREALALLANQPATRLHSQLDAGPVSQGGKVAGREPLAIHPSDAAERTIADGDVVLVRNERGACLAGALVTDRVRPGVVQLATGAWFTPVDTEVGVVCAAGNPNVLTTDRGTSRLAQGSTGSIALVHVERWDRPVPDVDPYAPPL